MANIKLLKYASPNDFDPSVNNETKPPIVVGGNTMLPLVKGKTIDHFLWLGADDKQIYLLHILLNDRSSILVRQGPDNVPQVVYKPPE